MTPTTIRPVGPQPAVRNFISEWAVTVILLLFGTTTLLQAFVIPSGSMENTLLVGDHVLVDKLIYAPSDAVTQHLLPYRDVQRGDIIVFHKPVPEPDGTYMDYLVKRCIGIPGDRIHLRNGIVYLNGVAQNEPYAAMPVNDGDPQHAFNLYRDDFPSIPPDPNDTHVTPSWMVDLPNHIVDGDLVVPPGFVFAMGDNRTKSLDGRYWGFVPRENIVGRPLFVYWSFQTPADQIDKTSLPDRIGFMGHILLHIFDQTRWSRTFHIVR